MNNLSYLYDLYNINYVKTTDDLSYAINWLLRYLLINNYDSKIIIKSYSNKSNNSKDYIFEGVLIYDKTINRIVKQTEYSAPEYKITDKTTIEGDLYCLGLLIY